MEKLGIIYKATSPSGKVYIGKTVNSLEERKVSHFEKINSNTKFARSLRKYSDQKKWEWVILYNKIPENQLDIAEICAIYIYDSYYDGYNCTFGGDGGNTWERLPLDEKERIKKIISESSKQMTGIKSSQFGIKRSQEHIQKIRNSLLGTIPWNKGISLSEEHRKKISVANSGFNNGMFGKHHSKETKNKISIKNSGENNLMFGKSIFDVWVQKYGIKIAQEKEKERREKISLRKKK